jgi:ATP-dependent Lhr-like helicase
MSGGRIEPGTPGDPLSLFDPLVAEWFTRTMGAPTEVQSRAWPHIARGEHVLVSAPTGTGKTLAAFLWSIDRLVRGVLPPGKVRVLYVSPLKALNNDIQRNLLAPLEGLETVFRNAGREFPRIRVLTRSGDTPAAERRRMLRFPPEILVTTPESLNLILSSPNARMMLDGVASVILDEIHAVASTKRGTHLITAVDRMVGLCGEFQRIALSATVRPLSTIADFIGGFVVEKRGPATAYRKRQVRVVHCPMAKAYDLKIVFPESDLRAEENAMWSAVTAECCRVIRESRSTLFFVNSRRHAEKLSRFINEREGGQMAWSHHGSLSKELRLIVEQRLKNGELKAIVATSSLELGIDIGVLDKVILVQTPFSVSSAVQRIGRAGHRIGSPSAAVILPLFGRDLVDAAVMARSVLQREIEEASPILCPLDVLAQILVSMTAVETWAVDSLFDAVRASFPFAGLSRGQFDLVLAMLCGKYSEARLRELSPLLALDALEGTVKARGGALPRLYAGGGTIPDRGYFGMRTAEGKALIGELDEEFVWERSVGDSFFFGTQGWRIQKIDHQNVEVVPAPAGSAMAPFWKAEEVNRDYHLSERVAKALEEWNARLEDPDLPVELSRDYALEPSAAKALISFLGLQRESARAELPHRHHLLIEHTKDPSGGASRPSGGSSSRPSGGSSSRPSGGSSSRPQGGFRRPSEGSGDDSPAIQRVVIHTMWGGRINKPYGLALSAAWEEKFGYAPEMIGDNDAILLFPPHDVSAEEIASLVTPENHERLLKKKLEGSGFFGARFRENASRALLLPRSTANRRMPLWFTRLRAKNLFAVVSKYDDFPMIVETWRTCLSDEFDMGNLRRVLTELADGKIRVGETFTSAPSPFCGNLLWKQTNTYMYEDDTPRGGSGTAVRGDLVRELVASSALRPQVSAELARELQEKLQRTAYGYAPRGSEELVEWVKERLVIPFDEWKTLLDACARDHGADAGELGRAVESKLAWFSPDAAAGAAGVSIEDIGKGGASPAAGGIAARENIPRIRRAMEHGETLPGVLSEWLRFYGPIEPASARRAFGLEEDRFRAALQDLAEEELVIVDRLILGADAPLVCDRENLERLLRIMRARARPAFRPLDPRALPLFMAQRHGLTRRGPTPEVLKGALERLFGFGCSVRLWEEEILPARMDGYTGTQLDSLCAEAGLAWFGCGRQKISLCFTEDVELFRIRDAKDDALDKVFPVKSGKYGFWELHEHSGLSTSALSSELWRLAWKGEVSNEAWKTLRQGIENGFRVVEGGGKAARRVGLNRWQSSRPVGGHWYVLPASAERDLLDTEEINRDRIRQLLQRYGVVFREALENELPPMRWASLFRSLRIMELSGEILAGRFFDGIPGLQFASSEAFGELSKPLDEETAYWMNAADPASLCGWGLEDFKGDLPARVPGTHLAFHGRALILVSRRQGRELEIRVPPDDARLPEALGVLRSMVERDVRPLPAVHVETVNGGRAPASPYRDPLLAFGFAEDYKRLTLRGRV